MREVSIKYYQSRLAIVRHSKVEDVFNLAPNIRESDRIEIWRSHKKTPETALFNGFANSSLCFTIERNEAPIAMFGIVPISILGSMASIWLLASPELEKVQKAFLRHSRHFIDLMLNEYPVLINYVDLENTQSIKWLQWCGAEMGNIILVGEELNPFQAFKFVKKKEKE